MSHRSVRSTSTDTRDTDGKRGHHWQATTVLLLTTTGRNSGAKPTTPLIYQRHGDDYLVVASNGGGDPPGWFLNLQDDPIVAVQAKASRPADGPAYGVRMRWPGADFQHRRGVLRHAVRCVAVRRRIQVRSLEAIKPASRARSGRTFAWVPRIG